MPEDLIMPEAPAQQAPIRLSLASYNIHRCFGTDGRYLPERTVEVLRALDGDILGVQEIDMRLLVDGRSQFDYFVQTLGMDGVPGPNIKGRRGKFGNALLSRWPIRAARRVDLAVRHYEPRGALDCEVVVHGRPVRVVVTHLGLKASERRLQVRRLLHALAETGDDDMPTIIMGDFNEWKRTGALRALNRRFGRANATPRSFPSKFPVLCLDRLWVWPPPRTQRLEAWSTPLTRVASDHLPLRAEIAWEVEAPPQAGRDQLVITKV